MTRVRAAADGASLDEMKKTVGDQLAPKYERGITVKKA
jgi:hypothetical protein